MTTPPVDLPPLTSDEDVLARIDAVVGPAGAQRLWLLFVNGDGRQSPAVVPISGLPRSPDRRRLDSLERILTGLEGELRADRGAVILTWERMGGDDAVPTDHEWAEELTDLCRTAQVPLRGVYLRTPGGVQRLR
jgi:protein gp37